MKKEKRIFEVNTNGDTYILYRLKPCKNKKTYFSNKFTKRYKNASRIVDKMSLKVIANDYLRNFKKSRNLNDYYNYLVYKNVYGDFFAKRCETEQLQKMTIDSFCTTNKNAKIQALKLKVV